jgi:hypothetical protein
MGRKMGVCLENIDSSLDETKVLSRDDGDFWRKVGIQDVGQSIKYRGRGRAVWLGTTHKSHAQFYRFAGQGFWYSLRRPWRIDVRGDYGSIWGPASGRRLRQSTENTDPRVWSTLAGVRHCWYEVVPPWLFCTTRAPRS